MEIEKLYNMLKKVQEPKGYYFSKNKERVFELLEALIINKERYGYMACPCIKNDMDIWLALADLQQVIGIGIRILSVPVNTGLQMLKNLEVATVISMFQGSGTKTRFPSFTFPRGARLKKCFPSQPAMRPLKNIQFY